MGNYLTTALANRCSDTVQTWILPNVREHFALEVFSPNMFRDASYGGIVIIHNLPLFWQLLHPTAFVLMRNPDS